MSNERFEVLDGWRGVCASLVALHHLAIPSHLQSVPFVRSSWLFVDFFFVLSGFVITHAYANRLATRSDIREFVIRRFGRLWPLHAFILACFVAIEFGKPLLAYFTGVTADHAEFSGKTSIASIFTNLWLIHGLGIHDALTWNTPSWSISTEFYTYLVFAAVCWLAVRKSASLFAAIAIIAASVIVLICFSKNGMDTTADFGFFRCLYGFFVGHLTYRIWKLGLGENLAARRTMIEAASLVLVIIFVSAVGHSEMTLAAPLVFAAVIWTFAHEGGAISRMMKTPAAIVLGRLSYSIYMVHWLVLAVFFNHMDTVVTKLARVPLVSAAFPSADQLQAILRNPWAMDCVIPFYLAAVIAVASLTYKFVERPGMRFFNAIAANRRDKPLPNASVPIS
jgi:peptidoglycan/LPS O-acetylase OafA/YrhL